MKDKKIKVFTDGATVGHNGKLGTVKKVGLGVYIPSEKIYVSERVKGISNNEAEFKALILAMKICIKKKLLNVIFNTDSKIVVNRAEGRRPKGKFWNERMNAFQDEIFELAEEFQDIEFKWIPRESNCVADNLSKQATRK